MYVKKAFSNVLVIFALFLVTLLYFEYKMRVNAYLDEKVYDLNVYYDDKLNSSQEYVTEFLNTILTETNAINIYIDK